MAYHRQNGSYNQYGHGQSIGEQYNSGFDDLNDRRGVTVKVIASFRIDLTMMERTILILTRIETLTLQEMVTVIRQGIVKVLIPDQMEI